MTHATWWTLADHLHPGVTWDDVATDFETMGLDDLTYRWSVKRAIDTYNSELETA
jgi:hypothetical protein